MGSVKNNSDKLCVDKVGMDDVIAQEGLPWSVYSKNMNIMLDMWLTMAIRRDNGKVFAIRRFPGKNADRIQSRYQTLNHPHLVTALQIFKTTDPKENLLVVSEFLPLHLGHIVADKIRPSDQEVSCIMGQILGALSYLRKQGLHHDSLRCSGVLLTLEGVIKIADFRDAKMYHGRKNEHDVKAAGFIMMEVMHQKRPADGRMHILDTNRGKDIANFLAQIAAGTSAAELIRHPFLSFPNGTPKWTPTQLCGLVLKAMYSAQVDYVRVKDR